MSSMPMSCASLWFTLLQAGFSTLLSVGARHSRRARAGAQRVSRPRPAAPALRPAAGAAGHRRHPRHRRRLWAHRMAGHRRLRLHLWAHRHPPRACVLQPAARRALPAAAARRHSAGELAARRRSSTSPTRDRFRLIEWPATARQPSRRRQPHLPPLRGELRRRADARRRAAGDDARSRHLSGAALRLSIRRAPRCWRWSSSLLCAVFVLLAGQYANAVQSWPALRHRRSASDSAACDRSTARHHHRWPALFVGAPDRGDHLPDLGARFEPGRFISARSPAWSSPRSPA